MFEKLLNLMAEKDTASSADLARSLGVSPALVDAMLEDLTRKGYLTTVAGGCSVACDGCPLPGACLYRRQARIWVLQPQGERLVAKRGKDKAQDNVNIDC